MERLFYNLKKFKNKIALISQNEKKYTYEEVEKESKILSSKVDSNSTIVIIGSNTIECILGYIAFMKSDNLIILLDENFKIDYIKKIIKKYQPNYVFSPNKTLIKLKKYNTIFSGKDFSLIKTRYKTLKKKNKINYLLLSTSGTTQSPKFVRLSHKNIINNTNDIIRYLKINSKHTTITTMPMAYSYGLSIINTHLHSGSTIIINNKTIFDRSFWNFFKKYKITSFGGVPTLYENLKRLQFDKFKFTYLKYLTQAGGKIEDATLRYFGNSCKKMNIEFWTMYGQTEASPRMSYLKWRNFFLKYGSIGKPLEGTKFKIMNDKRKIINKSNIVGELIFYGKNVSLGYSNNLKDLNKGDVNKGKLFTGDLAYKDDSGHYYIVGRKNRISKIFGLRINLDDVEKHLKKKKYQIKCVQDNKFLRILVKKNYNLGKIKEIIFNFCNINKEYIHISKVKKITSTNYFK
ncbi:AMP-binding protein [Candidatus Pelagibacter sp.]|nr:AMP-binding protein [Candidatus Pelagibacter sp.]